MIRLLVLLFLLALAPITAWADAAPTTTPSSAPVKAVLPLLSPSTSRVLFSHGPSIPFVTVGWEKRGDGSTAPTLGFLNSGAGYAFSWNLLPGADGTRWLTVSNPIFFRIGTEANQPGTTFAMSTGATIGTYNNMIALGLALDLFNLPGGGDYSGLLLGRVSLRNLKWLVVFNIPLGTGSGN